MDSLKKCVCSKIHFASLFFVLFVACSATISVADSTLHVGFTDNKPAVFRDENGIPQGIYVDVLNYIAGQEGWTLEYHWNVWDEDLRKLRAGELDLLLDIAYSVKRAEDMDFTQLPLLEDWGRIFVAPDSVIGDFSDLDGQRIGLVRGDIHTTAFQQIIHFLGLTLIPVMTESYGESATLFAQGKLDGIVLPNLQRKDLAERVDCVASDIRFNPVDLRFAAPKGKNGEILRRIDHHVALLKEKPSSLYYKSTTKWVEGIQRLPLPKWLNPVWLVSGVVSIFVFVLVFSLLLRSQVQMKTRALEKSIAIQQKQESELSVAKDIQLGLLPAHSYATGDYSLTAFIEPAKMVGGDFFDFFKLPGQRLCFLIADVADKGVPAALFMAATKTCLSVMARDFQSVAGLMQSVNREISENNPRCMFVTMFCGVLDLETGALSYTLAGHDPPFLLRENGEVVMLKEAHCMALGLDEDAEFEQAKVTLLPGDTLFMFTDGVSEAMNGKGKQFGEAAIQSTLQDVSGSSSDACVSAVKDAVQQFVGSTPPHDDITMLCLRRQP